MPRELTVAVQEDILVEPAWYVNDDGTLNVDKLLEAFQQFFRENSEHWLQQFEYQEAGPQLLLQAFVQRVFNGAAASPGSTDRDGSGLTCWSGGRARRACNGS